MLSVMGDPVELIGRSCGVSTAPPIGFVLGVVGAPVVRPVADGTAATMWVGAQNVLSMLPPRPLALVITGFSGVRDGKMREFDTKRCVCIEVPKYMEESSITLDDSESVRGVEKVEELCNMKVKSVPSGSGPGPSRPARRFGDSSAVLLDPVKRPSLGVCKAWTDEGGGSSCVLEGDGGRAMPDEVASTALRLLRESVEEAPARPCSRCVDGVVLFDLVSGVAATAAVAATDLDGGRHTEGATVSALPTLAPAATATMDGERRWGGGSTCGGGAGDVGCDADTRRAAATKLLSLLRRMCPFPP
jgi:hypothetical protein